jgi:hypothetical protein
VGSKCSISPGIRADNFSKARPLGRADSFRRNGDPATTLELGDSDIGFSLGLILPFNGLPSGIGLFFIFLEKTSCRSVVSEAIGVMMNGDIRRRIPVGD